MRVDPLLFDILTAPTPADARVVASEHLAEDLRRRIIPASDSILHACRVVASFSQ